MGVSILWQAVKGKDVTPGARSEFAEVLGIPCELDKTNIPWLVGLAAGRRDFAESINELLHAIHAHGRIRVWGEY